MTLSGRNGAGKSTLLRVLAGELAPDAGSLVRSSAAPGSPSTTSGRRANRRRRSASTSSPAAPTCSRPRPSWSGSRGRWPAATPTRRRWPPTPPPSSGSKPAAATAGATACSTCCAGSASTRRTPERQLSTFSGGELTRASLARALATRPDLLLLDEPTNHLDIPSLEWLESYLVDLDAAVVLVAHDRWFLEAVGTSVLELEAQRARFFAGPWHAWRQEQAAREIALGKAIERQQAEIERMERFVERFRYKATKAKQAQSRVKQIEKMKRDGRECRSRRPAPPALLLQAARAARPGRAQTGRRRRSRCPGRTLLSGAELEVERGEHVVLVGPNGAGKTTLIETLAGRREPAAGSVRIGHNVKLGYLSQHADTAAGEGTVLDAAQRETGLTGQKARDLLGGFLFSGADVEKQLSDISGGEQRRLSLAILVASGANVLILDEPTNHLDIESREALEDALIEFEGAVVLVSHDRALLEAVGSRTIVCEDGELRSHPAAGPSTSASATSRRRAAAAAKPPRRRQRAASATARPSRPRRPKKRGRAAGKSDRAGRGGAARDRGGARRPRGLVEPGPAERAERAAHARRSETLAELFERGRRPEAEVSGERAPIEPDPGAPGRGPG